MASLKVHEFNITDLDLLYLVLDDALLVADGRLQVLVSLQQSVPQLRRQLKV